MSKLIEYKEGASYFNAVLGSWEDKVTSGDGWAYGGELFVQKKVGRTTGWLGYTLSKTERTFDELNNGQPFPYRYDRRHDVSLVLNHRLRRSVEVSAAWVYGTGQAFTLPAGTQVGELPQFEALENLLPLRADPKYYSVLSDRNGVRFPAYHRLDLSVLIHKHGGWADRTLSVGVYNAYSRRNAFSVYTESISKSSELRFKKVSLLPIVPSITYQIKF